jgi:hypothetical protein
MPSLYTENSEKWKSLASIDYFTQFVKAWIPFNAWYKNYYPHFKTDREAIDYIKANPNKFRDRFVSLLNSQDNDGAAFKSRLAELHLELERKYLRNKENRITFLQISIESNTILSHSFSRNNCKYEVERGKPNRKGEVDFSIYGKNGMRIFSYTQTNGFDLSSLSCCPDFQKLSKSQQKNLIACSQEIDPLRQVNLVIQDHELLKEIKRDQEKDRKSSKCIEMSNIFFVNDTDLLCKGIIEILYKLRNVLFHGEIIPDSDTNKVYAPAYHILYTLVQAL